MHIPIMNLLLNAATTVLLPRIQALPVGISGADVLEPRVLHCPIPLLSAGPAKKTSSDPKKGCKTVV